MVLKIKLVFENYATFYLSALYKKRKKKQTKSKVYICCQLNMKSSSFWDTYLLWQNIINYWIPDEKQWLDESKYFVPCESGNYKRCNLYYGYAQSFRQRTILYYGNPLLPRHWKPENRHEPWTENYSCAIYKGPTGT